MNPGGHGRGQGRGPSLTVVLAAAASALVVVGLGVAIILLVRDSWGGDGGGGGGGDAVAVTDSSAPNTPAPATTAVPVVDGPPGVLEECGDSGESVLPRSGRGTDATTCAFAIAVRDAYFRTARPGDPALVEAVSPVTGQSYEMGCVANHNNGGIICRGGENAVVFLY